MTYGVEWYNASGNKILSAGNKNTSIVLINTATVSSYTLGGPATRPYYFGYSPYVTVTGMTATNTDEIQVCIVAGDPATLNPISWSFVPQQISTANRGTNQFRFFVLSETNASRTIRYFIMRN